MFLEFLYLVWGVPKSFESAGNKGAWQLHLHQQFRVEAGFRGQDEDPNGWAGELLQRELIYINKKKIAKDRISTQQHDGGF